MCVLQEKEIERIGGKTPIKVNIRVIAATNRNLQKEVSEGRFRTDLFFRFNVFPINLPPLRECKEDIPMLALHFILRYAKKIGKKITNISQKALQDLMSYNWAGNVRELEQLIERSILLTSNETIKKIHLPSLEPGESDTDTEDFLIKSLDENEREYILKVLKNCRGKVSGTNGAAHLLGVPTSTLNSKMKRLGIRREHIFSKHIYCTEP
ncbi:MAG TPA: sigma 54-interacting transcriptional regulator [Pyrinomonadaceae bacterium]|nr:sigma 54-interacting transcriptional regulator [Pyrinomonadaceae bacterium]